MTTALMDAEWQFRNESVLDPLTGLLNRQGLEARFAEVGEQARLLDQPVCLSEIQAPFRVHPLLIGSPAVHADG